MAESIFFDKKQRSLVGEALQIAEALAEDYFRVDLGDSERFPYDLQTLVNLASQEKTRRALAQVCKYAVQKRDWGRGKEFYRICLQDHMILNAVRAEGFPMLKPLLLYVITHELIHVIRFSKDPMRFYLLSREKMIEERHVHRKTYELLRCFKDPQVDFLLERYRPFYGKGQSLFPSQPLTTSKNMPNLLMFKEVWGDS